ncbi:ABC transporter permease [Stieleria varia]|uniref:ABC-2 family transporter protein n=1 Tax=Stieleria varia TaxID=2528005 RepID=A0A5C6B6X1_9BACT|nr:ABC transporter permease [Stieleria varia]TWU08045.1 ABC-2 family transporter protein [Stieleria varia]
MKPYLAVLIDSFHSAMSSRILWIAFFAIWAFLALLAPIGYQEDYTTTFRWMELQNGTQMKAMLARGLIDPSEKEKPLGRLVASFPDELKDRLRQVGVDEIRIRKDVLADALNDAIDDEGWYDAEAWKSTLRLRELRELDELPDAEITDSQRRRRARLRIEAALPGIFAARTPRSITLSYAGFALPSEFAIGKPQFITLANQFILPLLMNWLLGLALIFVGILVTSSMIPDMLQPGSLHLLLSKPISRTMLLLSKFVGGCAFVLLCVTQLVVGLWLIAGLRLDIWNARILWCIPVSVFLFSVYFSVSLLAGLRWRSPILSIGVTCIFAAVVMIIGFVGGFFDGNVTGPDTIQSVVVNGDAVVVATRGGSVKRWDDANDRWDVLVDGKGRDADVILAPTVLDNDHIATARISGGRFNPFGSGTLNLLVLNRDDDWKPESALRLPIATRRLYSIDDKWMMALNTTGLAVVERQSVLDSAGLQENDPGDQKVTSDGSTTSSEVSAETQSESVPDLATRLGNLFRMQGGPTDKFRPILPSTVALALPARVVVTDDQTSLIVYTRGRLMRLKLPESMEQRCEVIAERTIEGDESLPTVLAVSGDRILLARDDEAARVLDANTLDEIQTLSWQDSSAVVISVAGMGVRNRFVLVNSDGQAAIAAEESGTWQCRDLTIDDVTALSYDAKTDVLAVAHDVDQVDLLGAADLKRRDRLQPQLQDWRFTERYFITPLRTLTPQTVELTGTVGALISGKSSFALVQEAQEERDVIQRKMVRPLVSCSAFILVMLTISCVYFSTRDF